MMYTMRVYFKNIPSFYNPIIEKIYFYATKDFT